MKLQAAFEYLMIVGLLLAFMIPLWIYIVTLQQETNTQLTLSYADNAVRQFVETADLVHSQGPPARVESSIYIPNGIESINITNNTIIFKVRYNEQFTDITAISNSKLNGTLPTREGNYLFSIEAKDNFVQITEVYNVFQG